MSATVLQRLFDAGAEGVRPCPGCAASITFARVDNGRSLEVTHPQPPCPTFREFVADLYRRRAEVEQRAKPSFTVKL